MTNVYFDVLYPLGHIKLTFLSYWPWLWCQSQILISCLSTTVNPATIFDSLESFQRVCLLICGGIQLHNLYLRGVALTSRVFTICCRKLMKTYLNDDVQIKYATSVSLCFYFKLLFYGWPRQRIHNILIVPGRYLWCLGNKRSPDFGHNELLNCIFPVCFSSETLWSYHVFVHHVRSLINSPRPSDRIMGQ